jgi:hypothetical protein
MKRKITFAFVLLCLSFTPSILGLEPKDIAVDFSTQPKPVVGVPTELLFVVKDASTGEPLKNIEVKVDIVIVEDALTLYSGNFYLPEGKLKMTYHFQDATEHAINLLISPARTSRMGFPPTSKTFLVDIASPKPPTRVWLKTWLFLVGLVVIGIAIGYYGVRIRAKDAA